MTKIRVIYIIVGSMYGSDHSFLNLISDLNDKIELLVLLPEKSIIQEELDKRHINYFNINISPYVIPKPNSLKNIIAAIPLSLKGFVTNTFMSKKIKNKVISFKPDIIHTNTSIYKIGFRIAKSMNIKHVWHIREYVDLDFQNIYIGGKKRFINLLHKNQYNIAITEGIYNHFELKSPSVVVYNGIRKSNDLIFNRNKNKNFLFVGNITENKGFDYLLNSFALFSKVIPEYKLLVAGNCHNMSYKNYLMKLIKKYNLEDRVEFLGHRKDINFLMSTSTAIVVPSKHEAFGRVVAEAMFNGCLVIGNNTDGIKEQFDNGTSIYNKTIGIGFNFENNNLDQILIDIVSNGIENYFELITNAGVVVSDLYSIEKCSENIYSYYLNLLDLQKQII